jgi:SAM-dependent methyltransferase
MRITYRAQGVKEYWEKRWTDIPADHAMTNHDAYPLKYAEMTVTRKDGCILEAGCGAGRILRYYHDRGYDIVGMDFIEVAIQKLKQTNPTLRAEVGDITRLHYADGMFKYVLAFGLYHNLETGLDRAVGETCRVLQKNGRVCASFRADNIQTRLTDWLAERRAKAHGAADGPRAFHKMNLTRTEYEALFTRCGFIIEAVYPVENMPILYKFALFRAPGHKTFDENLARKEGYRLSSLGRVLQSFLMRTFPDQFCNIYVLIARKLA